MLLRYPVMGKAPLQKRRYDFQKRLKRAATIFKKSGAFPKRRFDFQSGTKAQWKIWKRWKSAVVAVFMKQKHQKRLQDPQIQLS